MDFLFPELSYAIRGACFEVYKSLGSLHKESIYHKALVQEFNKRKIIFEEEKTLPVIYNSVKVGDYRADFVVDRKIIVEIKATQFNLSHFEKQLFYYLGGSDYKLGFLVNFGVAPKVYIRRWVMSK